MLNLNVECPLTGGLQCAIGRCSCLGRLRPSARRSRDILLLRLSPWCSKILENILASLLWLVRTVRYPGPCCTPCARLSITPGQLGTPSGVFIRSGGAKGGLMGSRDMRCGDCSDDDCFCEALLEYCGWCRSKRAFSSREKQRRRCMPVAAGCGVSTLRSAMIDVFVGHLASPNVGFCFWAIVSVSRKCDCVSIPLEL